MVLGLLCGLAWGAPSVEYGWAWFRVGDYVAAERIASAHLASDPSDLAAGRLHLRSRARLDGDGAAIAEARAALADAPGDAGRRLMLADALVEAWRFDEAWCDEITELLGVTPGGEARFWAHALRYRALTRRCRGGVDSGALDGERVAALGLASEHERLGVAVPLALVDGVDAREGVWLAESVRAEPGLLGLLGPLWEVPDGPGAKRARQDVLRVAEGALAGRDLALIAGAAVVFEAASARSKRPHPGLARAEALLVELHPDPHRYGIAREVSRARRHADPAVALAQVDALTGRVASADAETRAYFASTRGDLLWEAGRLADAVAAYREAWTLTPDHGDRANLFAYRSSALGLHLDEALQAASVAVDAAGAQRFAERSWTGETWEAWRERTAAEVGSALDTRGWVLHQLGRDEEAAVDLVQASRLVDVPVVHLHAGIALAAIGEAEAAAPHLARGVQERDPREAHAIALGWEALGRWWGASGRWHPGGVRGWVADLGAVAVRAPSVQHQNPWVGRTLPSVEVTAGGRPLDLAELDGPVVLDFWATWCRPCVESLPKLQELAARHRGVRFIAVSVDARREAVDAFFGGRAPEGYEVAWWSASTSPYEALAMSAVPSLFVIGPDRKVATYLLGSDVNRLGEAVEAVSRAGE